MSAAVANRQGSLSISWTSISGSGLSRGSGGFFPLAFSLDLLGEALGDASSVNGSVLLASLLRLRDGFSKTLWVKSSMFKITKDTYRL